MIRGAPLRGPLLKGLYLGVTQGYPQYRKPPYSVGVWGDGLGSFGSLALALSRDYGVLGALRSELAHERLQQ